MALKIRLARGGAKKRPFYSIVVAESRSPRDGRFIEKLGTYNPMLEKGHKERVTLKTERIQHWIKMGALPSERVTLFLADAGMMKRPEYRESPLKSMPRAERRKLNAPKAEGEAAAAGGAAPAAAPAAPAAAPAAEKKAEAKPAEKPAAPAA
ncbi:MAG TPA: 30S ribosomal protein S16 [Stellaceae bacterium]|jgi:small subunit ribosomal protein S16|nr:30S ribosomal protein S16 [Stellaceae bacterium]